MARVTGGELVASHTLERIPEYMAMAFRELHGGKPGPVFLEIPTDILFEEIEESEVSLPERYRPEGKVLGDPEMIERAVDRLSKAERPLVVVGSKGSRGESGTGAREGVGDRRQGVRNRVSWGVAPHDWWM